MLLLLAYFLLYFVGHYNRVQVPCQACGLALAACGLVLVAWALILKPVQVPDVNFLHPSSGSSTHKFSFLQLTSQRQTVCVLAAAARWLIPDPSGRCTSYYECANLMDQGSVGLREVVFLPRRASSDLTTDPRSSLPVLKQGWTYYPLDQGSAPRKDGSYKAVWSWV